jgi:hypothetical protein
VAVGACTCAAASGAASSATTHSSTDSGRIIVRLRSQAGPSLKAQPPGRTAWPGAHAMAGICRAGKAPTTGLHGRDGAAPARGSAPAPDTAYGSRTWNLANTSPPAVGAAAPRLHGR